MRSTEQDWDTDDWAPQELGWILIVVGAWSTIMVCVGILGAMWLRP